MIIPARVAGIPCLVDATVTGSYVPAKTNAEPDYCYEAEYPELEYDVLDSNGREAPWLERKLIAETREELETYLMEKLNDMSKEL